MSDFVVAKRGMTLTVDDYFDNDGELCIDIEESHNNSRWLTKSEVVQLRDHLSKLLEG